MYFSKGQKRSHPVPKRKWLVIPPEEKFNHVLASRDLRLFKREVVTSNHGTYHFYTFRKI